MQLIGYFAKKWVASIVSIPTVCFVGFYDLAADEDKIVRRFLKRTRCTLCVALHTLCTLVVSIPMGSLYLRPLSTPDGSFRAQFPKGALKTPKSLYYQLLLRCLELLRHSTSKFLVEESWSWSTNCCGIFLHSELRRCPSILFWPLARPTLHWTSLHYDRSFCKF